MATSGDLYLATSRDIFMATDTSLTCYCRMQFRTPLLTAPDRS